jgi:hypothetical protein
VAVIMLQLLDKVYQYTTACAVRRKADSVHAARLDRLLAFTELPWPYLSHYSHKINCSSRPGLIYNGT